MSGYCEQCGNTICICETFAEAEKIRSLAEVLAIAMTQVKDDEGRFLGLYLPTDHAIQMADFVLRYQQKGKNSEPKQRTRQQPNPLCGND